MQHWGMLQQGNLGQCSLSLCPQVLHCNCLELYSVEGSPKISCGACWHVIIEYLHSNNLRTHNYNDYKQTSNSFEFQVPYCHLFPLFASQAHCLFQMAAEPGSPPPLLAAGPAMALNAAYSIWQFRPASHSHRFCIWAYKQFGYMKCIYMNWTWYKQ